ncbi:glycosyltransferase family 2 protein [Marmoricola sp. URHB0036]|jgi:N-acetylglucosaminyl-diphospho-decaprenol L-rhamnosyltransferase|uniref:glycosyltransferase family 2 protein n=1 Tax=Marmoricola sp. URHB0036 TaxID=1298863 RepID=UPI0005606D89|nr:galactosyltransferase-related protein [Marmoricola sp. URHB0036]
MAPVAVITLAHERHDHLRRQHRSLAVGTRVPDLYVVVAIDDDVVATWGPAHGLTPTIARVDRSGPLPLARARNVGARTAWESGARTLVFLDVDCLAGPELVAAYDVAVTDAPGTIWSGPVSYLPAGLSEKELTRPWSYDEPHPARPAPDPGHVVRQTDPDLFWSLSFALHRDAWQRSGGFCEDYTGYGGEDTDFAQQAAQRGLDFAWVGSARAYHQHHPVQDPPVDHLDDIVRNATLFHARWGRWPMTGWLEEFERLGLLRHTADGWTRVCPSRTRVPGSS